MEKKCQNCKFCLIDAPWKAICRQGGRHATTYDRAACGKYQRATDEKITAVENFLKAHAEKANEVQNMADSIAYDGYKKDISEIPVKRFK